MSAFMVDKLHLDVILSAAMDKKWNEVPFSWSFEDERKCLNSPDEAGRIGAVLWDTNRKSVNHRYEEDEWEDPYVFEDVSMHITPVIVLKAISCYEYQSCEDEELWKASEARAFCEALRKDVIRQLPGYEDAPWTIYELEQLGVEI